VFANFLTSIAPGLEVAYSLRRRIPALVGLEDLLLPKSDVLFGVELQCPRIPPYHRVIAPPRRVLAGRDRRRRAHRRRARPLEHAVFAELSHRAARRRLWLAPAISHRVQCVV